MTLLLTFGFVTHASTAGGYDAVTKGLRVGSAATLGSFTLYECSYYYYYFIIIIIVILPSVSIPKGGLKIDENKLKVTETEHKLLNNHHHHHYHRGFLVRLLQPRP